MKFIAQDGSKHADFELQPPSAPHGVELEEIFGNPPLPGYAPLADWIGIFGCCNAFSRLPGVNLMLPGGRSMSFLSDPRFWNMKIKIAILTIATYLAMC